MSEEVYYEFEIFVKGKPVFKISTPVNIQIEDFHIKKFCIKGSIKNKKEVEDFGR